MAQRPRRNTPCTNNVCVQTRTAYAGMCAARAIAQRDLEALEARLGIQRVRAGGHARLPANAVRVEHTADARQNSENIHLLRSRLRSLNALIEQSKRPEENSGVVKAINDKAKELEESLDSVSDDQLGPALAVIHSLRDIANKQAKDDEEMHCMICYEPFNGSDAITGKNCYHYYHPSCVSMAAYVTKQPRFVDNNNPYWDFIGYDTDSLGVHTPRYRLKPEFLEQDGETAKGFPADTWLKCPHCQDPHYANDSYMRMVMQALNTLNAEDPLPAAPLSAPEQLKKWRDERFVLLVESPDTPGIVMLVQARVPGKSPPEGFPAYGKASAVYRQCGFVWDETGERCGGGKAYYRARHFDDVVDDLTAIEGELSKTAPKKREEIVVTEDTAHLEGEERRYKKQKTLQGGGAWKFDYPKPSTEEEEEEEAEAEAEA